MTTGNWTNADGLYLEFGTTKTTVDPAGEYKTYGDFREINLRIDLTALTSTPAIMSQTTRFPSGERIARIDVITDVAATGTGATLDIGIQKDDRSTELDYNGLVAALPLTSLDAVGETTSITVGGTGAGALIGTSVAAANGGGYITANYNTHTFDTGAVDVRIFLYGRGTITQ